MRRRRSFNLWMDDYYHARNVLFALLTIMVLAAIAVGYVDNFAVVIVGAIVMLASLLGAVWVFLRGR